MSDEETQKLNSNKIKSRTTEKVPIAQIFAEDMSEDLSKEAIQTAREGFALTFSSGDVHSTIADYIRKKFDRDHERGWNCVIVQPGTSILLWKC